MSFATTNVRSNRFIETSLDTPVVDLGAVSGNLTLDLGQSTKFRFTVAGNLTITFSNESVTKNLELWVLNEGFTVSWPGNLALSDSSTPTQILTYFNLQRVGGAWANTVNKIFYNNPYLPNTVCAKCCSPLTIKNLPCTPPICTTANFTNSTFLVTQCCFNGCLTCCCIKTSDICTVYTYRGNLSTSPSEKFLFAGSIYTGFCSNYNTSTGISCCVQACCYGIGYYSSGRGSNPVPFGFCICNCTYGYWDNADTRIFTGCYHLPMGFDDNGVYYYLDEFNNCNTFASVGTCCTTMTFRAACLCNVTTSTPSTGFYSTICNQCSIFTCSDATATCSNNSPVSKNSRKPHLTWVSCNTGVINNIWNPFGYPDSCECIQSLMFRCTGVFTYASTAFTGRLLSKAHYQPYFLVHCSHSNATANGCYGGIVYWSILYDTNWGTTSAPSLNSALTLNWQPNYTNGANCSAVNEGLILTGDAQYVITTWRPLQCSNSSWWNGFGCCTGNLGCVVIYCRCAASCNFCTTPVCFTACYTDASNWRYVGVLRDCVLLPWIDGERGSNWYIENVEVACRVGGVTTSYGICFNGTCWVVSSVTYACLCSTLGYDYSNALRPNGGLVKCAYPAQPGIGAPWWDYVACPNNFEFNSCQIPTIAPGIKLNYNYIPKYISTTTSLASDSVTSYNYTGKPYMEDCRE